MKRILTALLLLTLAVPAWGQDFEMGRLAYEQRDYATALREWRALAEQGNVAAEYNLGVIYRRGKGVPKDYAESVKWYRRAAEQGLTNAQFVLGEMYNRGEGVPQDYAEAVKWLKRASDQGLAEAHAELGYMYLEGKGVPKDYVQSHMWLNLAKTNGYEPATETRDYVSQLMTPAQIAEAQELAREWMAEFEEWSK